jgi:hypothetical protein
MFLPPGYQPLKKDTCPYVDPQELGEVHVRKTVLSIPRYTWQLLGCPDALCPVFTTQDDKRLRILACEINDPNGFIVTRPNNERRVRISLNERHRRRLQVGDYAILAKTRELGRPAIVVDIPFDGATG